MYRLLTLTILAFSMTANLQAWDPIDWLYCKQHELRFFTKEERENNHHIIAMGKKFLKEDRHTNWDIIPPSGYADTRYFQFYKLKKNFNIPDKYVGFSVEIIGREKLLELFSSVDLDAIYNQVKNLISYKNEIGVSTHKLIEKKPNQITFEWIRFKDDEGRGGAHRLVRIEKIGDKIIFKKFTDDYRILTRDDVELWRRRFDAVKAR